MVLTVWVFANLWEADCRIWWKSCLFEYHNFGGFDATGQLCIHHHKTVEICECHIWSPTPPGLFFFFCFLLSFLFPFSFSFFLFFHFSFSFLFLFFFHPLPFPRVWDCLENLLGFKSRYLSRAKQEYVSQSRVAAFLTPGKI